MIANMTRNLQTNIRKLDRTQLEYNTGKKIHRPSDDPVGITRVLKIKSDRSELAQFKKNVEDASSWLENTEGAILGLVSDTGTLVRLRDIMIQGANGTLTAEQTKNIQNEVEQIKQQIISMGNTTYSGNYIFSGKNTDKPLLNADGTYNINPTQFLDKGIVDHRINYMVGVGEELNINTVGTALFEAVDLSMNITLPEAGKIKEINFLGAKISVAGNTATPINYDLKIDIEGIGKIEIPGLADEAAIYNEINDIFMNINDYDKPYDPLDPAKKHPTKPTLTFEQDASADPTITPKEAWNKLLLGKEIPVDINNLDFKTFTNSGEVKGIVAQPKKAGLINLIERIEQKLIEANYEEVSQLLGPLDKFIDKALAVRGDIGAKVNRTELILGRIEDDAINLRELQSKLEDADLSETAIRLMNEENVYRASLQVGARIIQPTLLDFLR